MYNPVSTYRLQFNKSFQIRDLKQHIDYLSDLGVKTIYASPLFAATPGSDHGYDVIDPTIFNPEITTEKEFVSLAKTIQKKGMGWLQDIVPNHMAFHTENHWLMDVLEKGIKSDYYPVFDIQPDVFQKKNPLMVPFLGANIEEVLKNKELKLGWHKGNFAFHYYENIYPVNFETFRFIVHPFLSGAPLPLQQIWESENFDIQTPGKKFLKTDWGNAKKMLQHLFSSSEAFAGFMDGIAEPYNQSPQKMESLLQMQHYELCHWQETEKRINYRRFFTVNGLICLRIEDDKVFNKYHQLIKKMIKKGHFSGLRIDHIDGLNNPNEYLIKLRDMVGDSTYIVAEKILESDEELPPFWSLQGDTGYDFLSTVNNLFTHVKNYQKLRGLYKQVTNIRKNPNQLIYENKKMILETRMHGEWDNISNLFHEMGFVDYKKEKVVTPADISQAIGEFMLACPVYRLYPRNFPLGGGNREIVEEIFETAKKRRPDILLSLEKLERVLLSLDDKSDAYSAKLEKFFARLMQFTGPLMAKGVEDTSMYQYNCFIAHNEVGDAINAKGISIEDYHRIMIRRNKNWPLTMSTTSTHDTKRGEDVRARLNVISVLSDQWEENVRRWMTMNHKMKIKLETGFLEPSLSVEYFIYQTLLGTFPFSGKYNKNYLNRIDEYMVKALREAKRKVSWRDPDETYENTVCEFIRQILNPQHTFLKSFQSFHQKVIWRGIVNSLSQLTLKFTSPGTPDIYQGTEFWDLSLVDPDNRQPVDYPKRSKMLKETTQAFNKNPEKTISKLHNNPFDGRIKLLLTHLLLNERKERASLYAKGNYIPVETKGIMKDQVIAYARNIDDDWSITIVPVITENVNPEKEKNFFNQLPWGDTCIVFPENAPKKWKNLPTGKMLTNNGELVLKEIFTDVSVAILTNQ
ncbi:MAG: malto-oligosyltrehalose synthase [Bacteroidales bacterium]